MNSKLTIRERMIASFLYVILIIGIGRYLSQDFSFLFDSSNKFYLLFVASALMLVMEIILLNRIILNQLM